MSKTAAEIAEEALECAIIEAARDFKLEAVIICDKYSDFLRHTLPTNKFLFNKLVIVTSHEDYDTRKLCEHYHVQCVPTDELETRHGKLRKGAGINVGLDELDGDGWVVHIDADIWLPPQTRLLLEQAELDKSMIYGVDRFLVRGAETWETFLEKPVLQHECGAYIHLGAFPLGTRVMQGNARGYVPIGFFQMWHPITSKIHEYPEGHTDAGREDGVFAMQWPRHKRAMIPEIVGYHLESDDASNALNWSGRKSAPFTIKKGKR
jgi:hypothetical protein